MPFTILNTEYCYLVLQRNNSSGFLEVILSLDKANKMKPVLADTVNPFELITGR